jgi:hypothetical protein
MALTEIYVDPSIGTATGAGTIGDPYGDLQYAFNTATRDATNGNRMNVKAGSEELLTATLSLATFGAPTNTAPCVIQGFTATAGDGGKAVINANGAAAMNEASSVLYLMDLEIYNGGAADLVTLADDSRVFDCEVHGTTGSGIAFGLTGLAFGCHVHDCGDRGISLSAGGRAMYCYLANGANDFVYAIECKDKGAALRNIISLDGASTGVYLSNNRNQWVMQNSILCAGGSGNGVFRDTGSTPVPLVSQNLIEGFSSGVGLNLANASLAILLENNGVYNCATPFSYPGQTLRATNNATLAASPFAKRGSNTFANRLSYFEPTGTVRKKLYNVDMGAAQSPFAGAVVMGGLQSIEAGI